MHRGAVLFALDKCPRRCSNTQQTVPAPLAVPCSAAGGAIGVTNNPPRRGEPCAWPAAAPGDVPAWRLRPAHRAQPARTGSAVPALSSEPCAAAQDAIFESHHPSQRFVNVLSQYRCGARLRQAGRQAGNAAQAGWPSPHCIPREASPPSPACSCSCPTRSPGCLHACPPCTTRRSTYPAALWEKIESHFPHRRRTHPTCVDIAIGAEGRGGVELARRWAWPDWVCPCMRP